MGHGSKKSKVVEEELGSKRIKVDKVEKSVTRKERNETLRSQKVLIESIFNSRIFDKPGMVELVECVKHRGWLHLLEKPFPLSLKME